MKRMILALVLMGLVMAVGSGAAEDVRQNMLEAKYAQLECRASFMYGVMDNTEEFNPSANMEQERVQLQEQMQLMQQYANEGDSASFNREMAQVRTTYTNGMNAAREAHRNALNSAEAPGQSQQGANASDARTHMRNQMLEKHQETQNEQSECMETATRTRVQAEVSTFNQWHGQGQETVANMEGREYDVSGLQGILAEAEETSNNLEDEMENAEDYSKMAELRKNAWEKEFYLWAEFHVERFNLVLNRINENSDGEYAGEVEQIRALLGTTKQMGSNGQYTVSEAAQAKETINEAAGQIRSLVTQMGAAE